MHAHNITTEDYSCANKMYLTVIQELEDAIDNIINNKIIFENIRDFNDTIVLAIDDEIMSNLRDSMSTYTELLKGINIPDFSDFTNAYKEQLKAVKSMSGLSDIRNAYREHSKWLNNIKKSNSEDNPSGT